MYNLRVKEWPKELHGKLAWEPGDFVSDKSYTLYLTREDVQEIYAALSDFKSRQNSRLKDITECNSLRLRLIWE